MKMKKEKKHMASNDTIIERQQLRHYAHQSVQARLKAETKRERKRK